MAECVRCGAPTDAYACSGCVRRAGGQLAEIAELAPDARAVADGQVRRGDGGSAGKPGSRPPLNLDAAARLDEIRNRLGTWARVVIEERGVHPPHLPHGFDVIAPSARFLAEHLGWWAHRAEVDEFLADAALSARQVAGMVNGRIPGRYAGPCSAMIEDPTALCPVDCDCHGGAFVVCSEPGGCGSAGCGRRRCGQDVEARPGAAYGRCRACGAEYDVDEQQAWMRGEIEGWLARPTEIAGVLLRLGFKVGYSTIAAYVAGGRLVERGRDEQDRPLFRIGDVMNLRMGAKQS